MHSNFSGADFTPDQRNQLFVTGGLFRRTNCGLQGGLVFDYLQDDWYANLNLVQLRGEASWVYACQHEWGLWFSASLSDDTQSAVITQNNVPVPGLGTAQTTDLYALFYRHRFGECGGSAGRLYSGFTGNSEGILGGDLEVPVTQHLALSTGFIYLIPDTENTGSGISDEAWNLSINLVWTPWGCAGASGCYYRPLLNVADNGSMIVRGSLQ